MGKLSCSSFSALSEQVWERVSPMVLPAVAAAALGLGCATTAPASRAEADAKGTIERLRAENASQTRKVEELENQVFILTTELENRRKGEPPPAPPPALPELKLSPHDKAPSAEAGPGPTSLVDEAEVEYAGAAAEKSTGKRPVLKIWGPNADLAQEDEPAAEAAPPPIARDRRRAARAPRPLHPELLPRTKPPEAPKTAVAAEGGADLYQSALVHLRSGRHDDAVVAFRAFVTAHPRHDLADNAQYWLGECFYDRKDYSNALREFRRVVEAFPTGNKVPDALLKLGLSYLALGSARPGRESLSELVQRFPRHPAAALAEARLRELPEKNVAAALAPASKEVR
jgi:tol-pal system protein YbgF